jgi:MFS family permease
MDNVKQTSKEYFKALQVIYFALIAGQIIFGLIAFFLNQEAGFYSEDPQLRSIFIFIVPVFVIGGFMASKIFFKKRVEEAKNKTSLIEKMSYYRAALILRYAFLEGPTFLSIIVYLLTNNWYFLVIAGFMIVIFFTIMPTSERASNELELNKNERQIILDADGVIENK